MIFFFKIRINFVLLIGLLISCNTHSFSPIKQDKYPTPLERYKISLALGGGGFAMEAERLLSDIMPLGFFQLAGEFPLLKLKDKLIFSLGPNVQTLIAEYGVGFIDIGVNSKLGIPLIDDQAAITLTIPFGLARGTKLPSYGIYFGAVFGFDWFMTDRLGILFQLGYLDHILFNQGLTAHSYGIVSDLGIHVTF